MKQLPVYCQNASTDKILDQLPRFLKFRLLSHNRVFRMNLENTHTHLNKATMNYRQANSDISYEKIRNLNTLTWWTFPMACWQVNWAGSNQK